MDAGLLDVLHHRADLHLAGAVPHRVDVHLGGVLQEAVHQHGALRGRAPLPAEGAEVGHLVHGGGEFVVVVDDGHGPAAQHIGGPDQHRIADPGRHLQGLGRARGRAAGRLGYAQAGAQSVPALAVLGRLDRGGRGAQHQLRRKLAGQCQRCLAAERHDHAHGILGRDHVGHVLGSERLEVEAVVGVVVGGHGLRVAVHHHGLVPGGPQGLTGVDAAVVELDALPDPVGTRSQDHDPGFACRADLVGVLVGGVVVRGARLEFGRTGVDRLEGGQHPRALPGRPDVTRSCTPQVCELGVGESEPLGPTPPGPIHGFRLRHLKRPPLLADAGDLVEEPRVHAGGRGHGIDRLTTAQQRLQLEDPLRRRHRGGR